MNSEVDRRPGPLMVSARSLCFGYPGRALARDPKEPMLSYNLALAVQARVGRGSVRPVRQEALGLAAPRPRDARLFPAVLPGWRSRVDALVAAAGGIL